MVAYISHMIISMKPERMTRNTGALWLSLALLLLVLGAARMEGQVNTEKLRRLDSTRGVFANLSATAGLVRGNSEYVAVGASARVDHAGEGAYHFLVGRYEFKEAGNGKIANKGFVHARGIRDVADWLALEAFGQVQYNEFISLRNRTLLGGGARWTLPLPRDEEGHEWLRLHAGTGIMHEYERYGLTSGTVRNNRPRLTSYLTLYMQYSDRVTFTAVSYYQPRPDDFADFRFIAESSLAVHINKVIAILIDLNYRHDSRPIGRSVNYDLELSQGISVTLR